MALEYDVITRLNVVAIGEDAKTQTEEERPVEKISSAHNAIHVMFDARILFPPIPIPRNKSHRVPLPSPTDQVPPSPTDQASII